MKTIALPDGRTISYELTRKPVKNINLRLRPDGAVNVSASSRVPIYRIEQLLTEHADSFLKAAERAQERERKTDIASLESVNWLGENYPVRIIRNARETAVLDETELRVFTQRADEEEYLRALVTRTIADNFVKLCGELNGEVRSALAARGLEPPPTRITVKDMRSRWGSCSYTRGNISINIRLAAYPRQTVLSVFWHEYAHYWHHDHSREFYAFLERHYPEYYKWNGLLKS